MALLLLMDTPRSDILRPMPPHSPRRRAGDTAVVRLTRKLADRLDGIDLNNHQVGDVLHLLSHDARLLIAEGWAERMPDETVVTPRPRRMRR